MIHTVRAESLKEVINFEEKPVENNRALTKKKKLPIS
jgi:hypothetical protein